MDKGSSDASSVQAVQHVTGSSSSKRADFSSTPGTHIIAGDESITRAWHMMVAHNHEYREKTMLVYAMQLLLNFFLMLDGNNRLPLLQQTSLATVTGGLKIFISSVLPD